MSLATHSAQPSTLSPSAGADWAKGGLAASIYLYVETNRLQNDASNDFGCKVPTFLTLPLPLPLPLPLTLIPNPDPN